MLSKAFTGLRAAAALIAALLLLFTLSYPDMLVPEQVNYDPRAAFSFSNIRAVLWCFPLLLLEIISAAGTRRNVVWFTGLVGALAVGIIIYPILQAEYPELVRPTFFYEDGKLAEGLSLLALLFLVSLFFRFVILRYLFHQPLQDEGGAGAVEAEVLNPEKARTVYEIAAHPIKPTPRFLFGKPDQNLIGALLRLLLNARRRRCWRLIFYAFPACLAAIWFFAYPQPTEAEAFVRDMNRMYNTQRDKTPPTATYAAVHAAYRAMKYLTDHAMLDGLTFPEAEQVLNLRRVPTSYRNILRDDTPRSYDPMDALCMRLLSVSDGQRSVTLYARTNEDASRINITEVAEVGWNAPEDARRFGLDSGYYHNIFH